jgi:hypothetical protein
MKIVGAGFPRTGTLSTHAALTRLGYPCYHMAEVAMREDHTRAWHSFLVEAKPMRWDALFSEFAATVDAPAAFFYRDILAAYPEAKVLLNVREPKGWYASYMTLHETMRELAGHRSSNPRLDLWLSVVEALHERALGGLSDEQSWIRAFNDHNRQVQDEVPQDRLLVFRVQDGWRPLCDFLGSEVPEESFPHLNEGSDTVRAGLSAIFGIV